MTRTPVARHEDRPKANFYIKNFSQFTLLSGDRYFGDMNLLLPVLD